MQSKNSKCNCGSGKNYKNCCMGKVNDLTRFATASNAQKAKMPSFEPLLYNYSIMPTSPAFEGMPKVSEENEPDLATYLTLKIHQFKLTDIFWGKAIIANKLAEQDFRQYEFDLNKESKNWFILLLIIKEKEKFFTHQEPFYYLHNNQWQVIPIKYTTLSGMTDAERSIIFLDFD